MGNGYARLLVATAMAVGATTPFACAQDAGADAGSAIDDLTPVTDEMLLNRPTATG